MQRSHLDAVALAGEAAGGAGAVGAVGRGFAAGAVVASREPLARRAEGAIGAALAPLAAHAPDVLGLLPALGDERPPARLELGAIHVTRPRAVRVWGREGPSSGRCLT